MKMSSPIEFTTHKVNFMCANFPKKIIKAVGKNPMKAYGLLQRNLTTLQMYETTSLVWLGKKVAYGSNLKTNGIGT